MRQNFDADTDPDTKIKTQNTFMRLRLRPKARKQLLPHILPFTDYPEYSALQDAGQQFPIRN
jgi:hypothetical protein